MPFFTVPEDKGYLFSRPVPDGWSRDVIQRKSGKSAGKYDVYVFRWDNKIQPLQIQNSYRQLFHLLNKIALTIFVMLMIYWRNWI